MEDIKKDFSKNHWENIYTNKTPNEVSWTENKPINSLLQIESLKVNKEDAIIDIGGGDSLLVDFLLHEGYTNITVLDISEAALKKAKLRLGEKSKFVKWIVADINDFIPNEKYTIWHDRAAFHFLTDQKAIHKYTSMVSQFAQHVILATFSEKGPTKCSGLFIKQYSTEELKNVFSNNFKSCECFNTNHITPFETIQNFSFCTFKFNNNL